MRPGRNDKKALLLIKGEELDELQCLTGEMCEMFGLDRRIEKYQGERPIELYAWELEGLIIVVGDEIESGKACKDSAATECAVLKSLLARLHAAYEEVTGSRY